MTPAQTEEMANELFNVINQLTKAGGDSEKLFLAIEDLRAVTMRATVLTKHIYDAYAAAAAEEFALQLERDRA